MKNINISKNISQVRIINFLLLLMIIRGITQFWICISSPCNFVMLVWFNREVWTHGNILWWEQVKQFLIWEWTQSESTKEDKFKRIRENIFWE